MKIVSTFHPSSSVLCSEKCRLASRDVENLVVGKLNRIDVYALKPHGLQHECGADIWGKVCAIKAIPISITGMRSNLVVMITHPEPELIFFSYNITEDGAPELTVTKQLLLYERSPRIAEFLNNILIHPSGKLAVVSCYAGKLKAIVLEAGKYKEDFDVSIPEINLFSFAFLPNSEEYTLALLYLDTQERLQLCSRDIDIQSLELPTSTALYTTIISNKVVPSPTEVPLHLLPVQPDTDEVKPNSGSEDSFPGGVLVVGGRQILLFQLLSKQGQEKQKGKQKRLENRKKSSDVSEVTQAIAKEKERENRKRKPKATIEWPWSEVSAWCAVDESQGRFFIGDAFGRLSMLSVDNVDDFGMVLIPLGETSPPQTLTYLTNQTLYLGSHFGDSQLLQISPIPVSSQQSPNLATPPEIKLITSGSLSAAPSRKGKEKAKYDDMDIDSDYQDDIMKGRIIEPMGSFISVLETYKNVAPIMDAILVDTDRSGEKQIVTCSGGANTGSVNVIRNGADFQELALVTGILDSTNLWSVRSMLEDQYDSHLLVSTINGTQLFRIDDRGRNTTFSRVNSGHVGDLATSEPTLAFSNVYKRVKGSYVNSALTIQVLAKGPQLLEWDTGLNTYQHRDSWDITNTSPPELPPFEVVAASVNVTQVALALAGGRIVLLCIEDNSIRLRQVAAHETGREISAISCIPPKPKAKFTSLIIAAYWRVKEIEIFKLDSTGLVSIAKSPLLPSLVRSLLLYNFGADDSKDPNYHPYVIAGLGDGSIASIQWKEKRMKDLKVISLGHAPVNLVPCEVEGRRTIFAAGNRATMLYLDKTRLASSAIMLKEVSGATRLNTPSFSSSLALATPAALFIGRIRELNKLHIRSAPLGFDNPRHIAHDPSLKVFGVVCVRSEAVRVGNFGPQRSSFQLLDDSSLAHLGQYNSPPDEDITTVLSFSSTVYGEQRPFYCVGTFTYKQEETEPSTGKLLVFMAYAASDKSRKLGLDLSLVTSANVTGCTYALKYVGGKIVAAVNSSILLFRLDIQTEGLETPMYTLKKVAEWNHNYIVTSLGSFDDCVVAGDQISSVSLIKVTDNALVAQARDYGPLYPVSAEALSTKNLICANDSLNLYTMRLGTILGRTALERDGCYHLADLVSVFLRGTLSSVEDTIDTKLKAEIIYFTCSGRIGVIVDVPDNDLSLQLTKLQANLAMALSGIGGTSHAKYRAPKHNQGSSDADTAAFGFIDGDYLERFSGLVGSPERLDKAMKGRSVPEALALSEEEILKVIEQLESLH